MKTQEETAVPVPPNRAHTAADSKVSAPHAVTDAETVLASADVAMPRKIVQTRRYDWDFPMLGGRDTQVTYLLDPIAIGTRLTILHDGFCGLRDAAEQHANGLERFLGWLQAYATQDAAHLAKSPLAKSSEDVRSFTSQSSQS